MPESEEHQPPPSSANGAPPPVSPPPQPPAPPAPSSVQIGISDLVTLLQAIMSRPAGPSPTAAPASEPSQKQPKRFSRVKSEPASGEGEAPPADLPKQAFRPVPLALRPESERTDSDELPLPSTDPSAPVEYEAPQRRSQQRIKILWRWAVGLACVAFVFGLAIGWMAHKRPVVIQESTATSKPLDSPAPSASPLPLPKAPSSAIMDLINDAEAAMHARNWSKASDLLEQAFKKDPSVPGVRYQLAELALRRHDNLRADTWLQRSIDAGEMTAPSYALRGALATNAGNPQRALMYFEAATRVEPFTARYFFILGEALRRNGKLQEAVERMRQAADRAEDPAQQEYIAYLIRLLKVELGQEADFADELDAKLKLDSPPPDWLLVGAARELQHKRLAAGAELMRRAFHDQPANYVALRLDDVFFRGFAATKEIGAIYEQFQPPQQPLVPPTLSDPGKSTPGDSGKPPIFSIPGVTPPTKPH